MRSCLDAAYTKHAFAAALVRGLVVVMSVFASDGLVRFTVLLRGSTMGRMAGLGCEMDPSGMNRTIY